MTPDALRTELRQLDYRRKVVRAQLKRLEKPRKKPRVKRSKEETKAARLWRTFTTRFPTCWNCGRQGTERMHFVHSGGVGFKINDVRLVIAGCRLCHTNAHSPCKSYPFPLLTDARCVALKMRFDPEYYDPDFIKASNRNVAIEPEAIA